MKLRRKSMSTHSDLVMGDCVTMDKRVERLDLPKELWEMIGKHLNTTIDVVRFRSICRSWRSLLPLPSSHMFLASKIFLPDRKFCILQTKIYRLEPSSSSHQDSSSKGWMIKVGESKSLPLCVLDPFTNFPVSRRFPSDASPKVLNLMNFRVVELIEAYVPSQLLCEKEGEEGSKVVLFPSFPVEGRMVFALYLGMLCVSKIGDEMWTILGDRYPHYDDIILHKGQLYVVDKWGAILWIDCSSLELVQSSPPILDGFGEKKQLVESGGSLYVVDMYMVGERYTDDYAVADIKVYKLDGEWGRWLDVENLGDFLFVLGKDSNFSLSAQDYYGCEGNCIYFHSQDRASAFSLQNYEFKSPNLFWPCPTLFFHLDFDSGV